MKKNIKLDKETLIGLYYENKDLIVPIFAISISVLLFLIFIIPQLLSFPSRKNAVDAETKILNKIKESEKILSTANIELINSEVQLVARTLPERKPLEEALLAIYTAASLSNIQIESYNFQEITSIEPESSRQAISFNVNIVGELEQAVDFADQIYKTYPISSVDGIASAGGISTILIRFFYSPFVTGTLDDRTTVRSSTDIERTALEEITSWNEAIGGDILNLTPDSSDSGELNESPF
ncbi:MAG: hypothetical protein ACD_37C00671G0010 [uncultured bacterium]|nr:MAG: hypothetical protein ACD_37C00671G0010 [uncultured bacterium]